MKAALGGGDAGQRGNVEGFIQALGRLAVCCKRGIDAARRSIGRLTVTSMNGYGKDI
ncbi:hypothetical protein AWB69_00382 [Caballeronia udeis]|uniref:Uncharacterized protein n=1 Tax=Caballeronia udeis TaxID=1232866 RepID=A0A158EY99_9BURK|nr:hypothetical protein AWB69_00382 [Caballeronia udeis]